MAKTAVVNKRRKRKSAPKRRRRNYGAAAANPKRRRKGKRRRNPATATYSRGASLARRSNPGMFDMDTIMDTVPAATGGVWLGRWATKLAGAFEAAPGGVPEPGIKHAIAILIAANMGSDMLGNMLGSAQKAEYARIACLGWGGDMFLRKRFMRTSAFVTENLSLEGVGYDDEYEDEMEETDGVPLEGFSNTSALGAGGGDVMIGPDGALYAMAGNVGATTYPSNYSRIMENISGFTSTSALGMAQARPDSANGFGYAAR